MFITGINDTDDKLFTINPCHGFSVIAGVVDTGDKLISDIVDSDEKLAPSPLTKCVRNQQQQGGLIQGQSH
jgi:hypothetical protein